ncbi:MAG: TonB-dependent receptor plug domain-containing protein, partial [Cyclonatronaceae bacterium]
SFLSTTDENGRFLIDGLDIEGNVPINMRANREGGGDRLRIKPDEQFAHLPNPESEEEPFRFKALPADSLRPLRLQQEPGGGGAPARVANAQSAIEENVETQMQVYLDAVTVTAERAEDGDVFERDSRDLAAASQRLNLDERPELQDLPIAQVLARIPGVQTSGESISVRTGAESLGSRPSPYFIVDGIATDFEQIRYLRTADVQSIDVYRRAAELAIYGSNGTGGVIRINTRTGVVFQGAERGQLSAMVQGYQLPTRFYAPRYGFNVETDTEERDERITLYWNPAGKIEASDRGAARFFFWANDIPGRYRVQVEGLTSTGNVFSESTFLEIRPD